MRTLAETAYVRREIDFPGEIRQGLRGNSVRRVQEWLTYHGIATTIDGQFGPATEQCVRSYQARQKLQENGIVDESTWTHLVRPVSEAVCSPTPHNGDDLTSYLLSCARHHLALHPIELGGDNRGPWVRLYMGGNDGPGWFWCAGFVTFVLRQACEGLDVDMPIEGSYSCDLLASQAKRVERFVRGSSLTEGDHPWEGLGSVHIFLVRRRTSDWTHTGLSFDGHGDVFSTIEGNTNDEGSRNGYEVCARTRSLPSKDFIRLN